MVIKFFAYIREYTNVKETPFEKCEDLKELLQKLCEKYGKKFEQKIYVNGELSSEIIILINGRHLLHFNSMDTKLNEDDEISIFPVVAGG